ncbi:hypothetical protein [Saccharibacillus sacchari]|uniref:hypothetical protein n=1 Tax=Saccharibacillus sacchari TaxID=456493 RepID=UPI0004B8C32B|nr:hypothetical protein [Saccharibacillus sacchari]
MDIFIYVGGGSAVSKDEIEDALDAMLQDRGEVSGGGVGSTGFNVDIEVFEDDPSLVAEIRTILKRFHVPEDTAIVVDGKRFAVYEQES